MESEEEDVVHDDGEQSVQKRKTQLSPVFEVDSVALPYSRSMGTYHKSQCVQNVPHTSLCEHAVHFWRLGGSRKGELGHLDYHEHVKIEMTHLRWTIVMTSRDLVLEHERVLMAMLQEGGVMQCGRSTTM